MASNTTSPTITLNWKQLDLVTLEQLVCSQAGIDSLIALRGQNAAAVVDLVDQVPSPALIQFKCALIHMRLVAGRAESRGSSWKKVSIHTAQALHHVRYPTYFPYAARRHQNS